MQEEKEIDLGQLFGSILKKWKMITCITVICAIIGSVLSFFIIKPEYQVSTKLFIGKEMSEVDNREYSSSDVTMYQNLLETYAKLITTNDLIVDAIDSRNIEISESQVKNNIQVIPSDKTQILEIKFTYTDRYIANEVVESISNKFMKKAEELIPNGKIEVVESPKLPVNPVSPNKAKNIAISIVLGIAIGVGLAVVIEVMDKTFKNKEDLEDALGIPVIGVIPDHQELIL